jgi:hypothetical protein
MSPQSGHLIDPSTFDVLFPCLAFFLVIILPSAFAIYVIKKILTGQYTGEDKKTG